MPLLFKGLTSQISAPKEFKNVLTFVVFFVESTTLKLQYARMAAFKMYTSNPLYLLYFYIQPEMYAGVSMLTS